MDAEDLVRNGFGYRKGGNYDKGASLEATRLSRVRGEIKFRE